MTINKTFLRLRIASAVILASLVLPAAAMPVSVIGNNFTLLGFDDVEVNGTLWDVRFDDHRIFLYEEALALDFAQALFDLFVDDFHLSFWDTGAAHTNGCATQSEVSSCRMVTFFNQFQSSSDGPDKPFGRAYGIFADNIFGDDLNNNPDSSGLDVMFPGRAPADFRTHAIWTQSDNGANPGVEFVYEIVPVPAPLSGLLFALGLAALGIAQSFNPDWKASRRQHPDSL